MPRSPWTDLVEVDRPFAEMFRGVWGPWFRPLTATAERPFMPTTDVFRRNGSIVVRVELPGVDPEKDVTITLDGDDLVIKGERRADKEVKEEGYYRKESSVGYFERHVVVPVGLKEADIKATYTDGVLEIRFPAEPVTPVKPAVKTIPIATTPTGKAAK